VGEVVWMLARIPRGPEDAHERGRVASYEHVEGGGGLQDSARGQAGGDAQISHVDRCVDRKEILPVPDRDEAAPEIARIGRDPDRRGETVHGAVVGAVDVRREADKRYGERPGF